MTYILGIGLLSTAILKIIILLLPEELQKVLVDKIKDFLNGDSYKLRKGGAIETGFCIETNTKKSNRKIEIYWFKRIK